MMAVSAFALTSKAQVQLGVQGSYLSQIGGGNARLYGGGAHAKFFLGKNLALGAVVNAYPKTSDKMSSGTTSYTVSNVVTNLAASIDYLLSKNNSAIQPYIGVDAGINAGNQIVTYKNANSQSVDNSSKESHFLLAPKVGVNVGLGQTFGLFGQVQYNSTFGNAGTRTITASGVPNPITTKPLNNAWVLQAGIFFRLVGANKGR